MTDQSPYPATRRGSMPDRRGDSLADVLERVLDKGIVIAGDIRVDLLDIELLTIRIRLLISSADKAQELGMAWWQSDPFYTGELSGNGQDDDHDPSVLQQLVDGTEQLARRVAELEEDGRARTSGTETTSSSDDETD